MISCNYKSIARRLLVSAVVLCVPVSLFANFKPKPYEPTYLPIRQILPFVDNSTGQNRTIQVVDANDEQIKLRVVVSGQRREVDLPWDNIDLNLFYNAGNSASRAVEAFQDERYSDAASIIEPVAMTLQPLTRLPEDRSNVHQYINLYLEALLAAELFDKAVDYVSSLPLRELDGGILDYSYLLLQQLYESNEIRLAEQLARVLYGARPAAEFRSIALSSAESLLESGSYETAIQLLSVLKQGANPVEISRISAQIAFAWLQLGNMAEHEAAWKLVDTSKLDTSGDVQSLAYLVEGIRHKQEGNLKDALSSFGQALANARYDSLWRETLYTHNAETYIKLGNTRTASAIVEEMKLLFPNSGNTAALLKQIEATEAQ